MLVRTWINRYCPILPAEVSTDITEDEDILSCKHSTFKFIPLYTVLQPLC